MRIDIGPDEYRKLVILARRTLHTVFVWNDHNFSEHPQDIAKNEAEGLGISSRAESNAFLETLPEPPSTD